MPDFTIRDIENLFGNYGAYTHVDVQREDHESWSMNSPYPNIVVGGSVSIELSINFDSYATLGRLIKDLDMVQKMQHEEKLRRQSPAAQRAWEEYQIILKLTK